MLPTKLHPIYDQVLRSERMRGYFKSLLGPNIVLQTSKLNTTAPGGGACRRKAPGLGAAVQTGRTAPARGPNRGQGARPPPRPAGRVSSGGRMKDLLALHGRIALRPAPDIALSNADLDAPGLPVMTPRAA
jgi:hypothetical protein